MKKILANENIILSDNEKKEKIQKISIIMKQFLDELGFDSENDPNLKDTHKRIAKMYVNELLSGNFSKSPDITIFPNTKNYNSMIISGPIQIKSMCSHHFVAFTGSCYISYLPKDNVIGLSKLARIAQYYMRRPQIQEELTEQITDHIEKLLDPNGVMVVIKAKHLCMCNRGVEESDSWMFTSAVRGAFAKNPETRKEFFDLINLKKD